MKIERIMKYLGIILLGPTASLYLIISGKGFNVKMSYFVVVAVGTVIAGVVTFITYRSRASSEGVVSRTVFYSIFIYVFITVGFVVLFDREGLMWLPIAIPFLVLYSTPLALSVAVGVDRMLSEFHVERGKWEQGDFDNGEEKEMLPLWDEERNEDD